MNVTTMRWRFSKLGSLIALLPITATFLLSILAFLLPRSWQRHRGSPANTADERLVFDPCSIMSILRASAAGGGVALFSGTWSCPRVRRRRGSSFFFIGRTVDNWMGFVESETRSPRVPYCMQAGKTAS